MQNKSVNLLCLHVSRWICVVCIQIFLANQLQSQDAQIIPAFMVRGRMEYKAMYDGVIKYAVSNSFQAICRGSKVSIRSTGTAGKNEIVRDVSTEYVSDGVTSYRITTFDIDQETIEKNRRNNESQRIFSSSVDVYLGDYPPNGLALVSPVWLALASNSMIDNSNEGEILPLVMLGPYWPTIGGEKLEATWVKSDIMPFLPDQVVTYANEKSFDIINKGETFFKNKPFPEQYKQGFTNTIYKVLAWTNVGSMKMPLHFQLVSFYPQHDGKDNKDLQPHLIYDGFVEAVTVGDVPKIEIPPKVLKWASVADYRFSKNNEAPLHYTSEFGELYSTAAAIANASAQDEVRMKINDAKYRPVVIGFMAIFSLGSIIILLQFSRNNNNNK